MRALPVRLSWCIHFLFDGIFTSFTFAYYKFPSQLSFLQFPFRLVFVPSGVSVPRPCFVPLFSNVKDSSVGSYFIIQKLLKKWFNWIWALISLLNSNKVNFILMDFLDYDVKYLKISYLWKSYYDSLEFEIIANWHLLWKNSWKLRNVSRLFLVIFFPDSSSIATFNLQTFA